MDVTVHERLSNITLGNKIKVKGKGTVPLLLLFISQLQCGLQQWEQTIIQNDCETAALVNSYINATSMYL